jgi:hypothetical protein
MNYTLTKETWQRVGEQTGWMKEAMGEEQPGQNVMGALDPKMKQVFIQALSASSLTKQQVLPFLEALFSGLGDIPISKVNAVIRALAVEEEAQPTA